MQAEAAPQNLLKAARGQVTVRSAAWTALSSLMKGLTEKADALKTPEKMQLTSASSSDATRVGTTSTDCSPCAPGRTPSWSSATRRIPWSSGAATTP